MDMKKVLSVAAVAAVLVGCECAPETDVNVGECITPGTAADFNKNIPNRVFFEYNKSKLSHEAMKTLDTQAGWFKTYPSTTAVIEGHTDVRGTKEYNLALGERRAQNAEKHLNKMGIHKNRISTVSYGKERPFATGMTEADHAQNRTAVTVVN